MCTVTWRRNPRGYQIFFNRDELKTREPATPPALNQLNGVRYLAPADGRAGGTWLAVNERGLSLGLLNFWEPGKPAALSGEKSRGLVIASLIDARTQEEIAERLHLHNLAPYGPFFLLAWAPDRPVHWHKWDGFRRTASILRDEDIPVTTSSFEPEAVEAARRARFAQMVTRTGPVTDLALAEYHRSTDSRGGAFSVFMTRPDAMTVSYSRVTVSPEEIKFYYAARKPGMESMPLGNSIQMAVP
jgi:hypothetical protein